MSAYVLSRRASIDLQQVWNYLAERHGFEAADKVHADIHAGLDILADNPGLAKRRPEIVNPSIRIYRVHSYYIAIVAGSSPMVVARVIHTARDLPRLF